MTPSIAERIAFGRPADPARDAPQAHAAPRPGTLLVGRILISVIFIAGGITKLMNPESVTGYMASQGIPAASTLVIVAGLAEVLGGVSILAGLLARVGAIGLILYLIPTTLIFHDFWTMAGEEQQMQMTQFLKNLAIIGGLSFLVAHGAGRYSLDAKLRGSKPA